MRFLTAFLTFMLLAGIARGDEYRFGKNPEPIHLNNDIVITRVSVRVPGFYVGGFADYCLEFKREKPPLYSPTVGRGGYVEPMCFNTVRFKSTQGIIEKAWTWIRSRLLPADGPILVPAGDWEQSVDLSETPVYLPAGSILNCNSLGATSSTFTSESMDGTCVVEYKAYNPGEPRYRLLRLPYYDQFFQHGKPLVTSYLSSYGHRTLHIESAVAYIGNNNPGSHMEACLTKERHGQTVDRFCFPPADQDSPGQVPISWTIAEGERIGLDCHYPPEDTTSSGDCAVYVVAKIPDDLKLSPENAFRDYGEIPRDYVPEWCEKTARLITEETVHDPKLCLGKDSCSYAEKMANCFDAFENTTFIKASCMADSSCYTSKKN